MIDMHCRSNQRTSNSQYILQSGQPAMLDSYQFIDLAKSDLQALQAFWPMLKAE